MTTHINRLHNIKYKKNQIKDFTSNLNGQNFFSSTYTRFFLVDFKEDNEDIIDSNINSNNEIQNLNFNQEEQNKINAYQVKLKQIQEKNTENFATIQFQEYNLFLQQSYFFKYIENKNIDDLINSVNINTFKNNRETKIIHDISLKLFSESNNIIEFFDIRLKQLLHTENIQNLTTNKNIKSF